MVVLKVKTLLGLKLDTSNISSYKTHRRMCFIVFLCTTQFPADDRVPVGAAGIQRSQSPRLTRSPFVFWVDLSTQNAYVRPLHRCLVVADIKYQKPHIALSQSSKIRCVVFSWLCSSSPAFRSRGRSKLLRALHLQ